MPHNDTIIFHKSITAIPEWKKTLLQHITFTSIFQHINDIFANQHTTITIVNDGGHCDTFGAFGWVIATGNDILIENQGPALGKPMSSHRAEALGKLSWIIFIKHLLPLLVSHPRCTFQSFLDNLEMVRQTQLNTDLSPAHCANIADYDILIAISNK
jgi:hypothetical protein